MQVTFNQTPQLCSAPSGANSRRTIGGKSLRPITDTPPTLIIPKDILNIILRYLDKHSLSKLERTEKKSFQINDPVTGKDLTELEWAQRKKEDFVNFKYGGCENERQRSKCEYFISKFIEEFMLKDQFFGRNDHESLAKMEAKYFPVYFRFPFLENFFKKGLRVNNFYQNGKFDNSLHLTYIQQEAADNAFKIARSKQEAGELMLEGMILSQPNMDTDSFITMQSCFYKAIEKNASCLTRFSKYMTNPSIQLGLNFYAAEHKGDERDLFELLLRNPNLIVDIPSKIKDSIFSILFINSLILFHQDKLEEGEQLFEKALQSKFPLTPLPLMIAENFIHNIILKLIGKNHLKNKILSTVLKISSHPLSIRLMMEYISSKIYVAKQESDKSKKSLIIAEIKNELYKTELICNKQTEPRFFMKLAELKENLDDLEGAEIVYEQVLVTYGDNIPAHILERIALLKDKLKKTDEALKFFHLTEQKFLDNGKKVNPNLFLQIGRLYAISNKFDEAEKYYELAKNEYGLAVPYSCYLGLAHIKIGLHKIDEAKLYFELSVSLCGPNPNTLMQQRLDRVKEKLNYICKVEGMD